MAALGAGMKSKILRRVGFPLVLDMYEFCDETLQAELTVVSDPLPPSTPPLDMYEFCDEALQVELTVVSDPLPPSTPQLVISRTVLIITYFTGVCARSLGKSTSREGFQSREREEMGGLWVQVGGQRRDCRGRH
eukprot:1117912-Prorocentrum_minimum.AAC.3